MAVLFCSFGIRVAGQLCVKQLQVLNRERAAVVVHLRVSRRTIIRPSVSAVESVQVVHVCKDAVLRVRRSVGFQSQIRKHTEPQPVSIRHLFVVHRTDPSSHIALLPVTKRIPKVLASNSERETNRTRLDHPLVEIFHITPELRSFGISARDQSFDEQVRLAVG